MPTWDDIVKFLSSYGPAIGLAATWGGILFAWWRRRVSWKRKSFIRQVNFSLNDVRDSTLVLRTLLEDDARKVWLNEHGVGLVLDAARKTTVAQPFVSMGNAEDQGYILRAVLNVLSERFAELHVGRTLGVPVKAATYVFGLTCEKYGNIRTQKLRVIIARPELLDALFGPTPKWRVPDGGEGVPPTSAASDAAPTAELRLEHTVHKDRLSTLRVLHRLWTSNSPKQRRLVDTVEIGIPIA
ncbi:MAG: hypothetical protein R3B68_01675 [Phycisphaerales bacterium]